MDSKRIFTRSQGLSHPETHTDDPESILRGKSVSNDDPTAQQNDFSTNSSPQDTLRPSLSSQKEHNQSATDKLAKSGG